MYDIAIKRAQQTKKFRDALMETGPKKLIHNMENDSTWGFGVDGTGQNLMGSTLERVRETLIRGEIQLDPMETPKPHEQNHSEEADTIIISDSMLRGVDKFIQKRKVELHIQGGATTNQIHESLGGLLQGKHPQVVVVHCGTATLRQHHSRTSKCHISTS